MPQPATIQAVVDQPPKSVDFTDLEAKRLDCLIAKLRAGQINNVVMRHLEVDGVLQLDPLVDLAKCD